MASQPKRLSELIREVLDERAQAVTFSAEHIEAKTAQLRQRLGAMQESAAARRRIAQAVAALPAERRQGWLEGVQAALKVVFGEAARSSRILVDAARDFLPFDPGGWRFTSGTALDGQVFAQFRPEDYSETAIPSAPEDDRARAESIPRAGASPVTVIAEDTGGARRVLATIRDFPADQPAPVLLIIEDTADNDRPLTVEVDPQSAPMPGGLRCLTYEAALPPGAYLVFLGNPRSMPE
jgi:chemotaxis response regulator CheB